MRRLLAVASALSLLAAAPGQPVQMAVGRDDLQQGGLDTVRDKPRSVYKRDCGAGSVISLASRTTVISWDLIGNCSIAGGSMIGLPSKLGTVSINGTLHVRYTYFVGVRLRLHDAVLHLHKTKSTGRITVRDTPHGGFIQATGKSEVHISSAVFFNAHRGKGGGISVGDETLLNISSSTFKRLNALRSGGAIQAHGAQVRVVVTNSIFQKVRAYHWQGSRTNVQGRGGAIELVAGTLEVSDSIFEDVSAGDSGGAIFAHKAVVKLTGLQIRRTSAHFGGFVYVSQGKLYLHEVLLQDTVAQRVSDRGKINSKAQGGAICAVGSSVSVELVNCTATNSWSNGDGGAIFQSSGSLSLCNVTFHNTTARFNGGAIHVDATKTPAKLTANGLELAQVSAGSGGGIHFVEKKDKNPTRTEADDIASRAYMRDVHVSNAVARAGPGGAFYFKGVSFHVFGLIVESASSTATGGVIHANGVGRSELHRARVRNTSALEDGGVVLSKESDMLIEELVVEGSKARYGGAISGLYHGSVTLRGAVLRDLTATEFGGAICMDFESDLQATDVWIENAESFDQGGAIWLHKGQNLLHNVTVNGATAGIDGGAIFSIGGTVSIVDSTFSRASPNWAYFGNAKLRLRNVTFFNLRGVFAVFPLSVFTYEDIHGSCPPHTEVFLSEGSFQCRPCDLDEGINGQSTLTDPLMCFDCPPNAYGVGDRGCLCSESYALNNSEFAAAAQRCVSCDQANVNCEANHSDCGQQQPPGTPQLIALNCSADDVGCRETWPKDHYWRVDMTVLAAVQCPFPPACRRTCTATCESGYAGPLCMVCEAGRHRRSRYTPCLPCSMRLLDLLLYGALALALTASVAASAAWSMRVQALESLLDAVARRTSYMHTKLKLVLFTMQAFSTLQLLRFPTTEVVGQASAGLSLLSLDVLASTPVAVCLLGLSAYGRYILVLLQVLLALAIALHARRLMGAESHTLLLSVYNLMLMAIAQTSFGFFACDDSVQQMTGAAYLLSDYAVVCYSFQHRLFQCLAGLVLLAWCGGIPLFLWLKLYRRRSQLNPDVPAPIAYTASAPEAPLQSLGMYLPGDHEEVLRCYGKASLLYFVRSCGLPPVSTLTSNRVSWTELDSAAFPRQVRRMRTSLACSVTNRVNTRKLLKQGLQALAQRREPSLRAYRYLYCRYAPDQWYYEFVDILGRIGYAWVTTLPPGFQSLVGLLLSAMLLLTCLRMPFRRPSDTYVAAACYMAMVGLFIAQTAKQHGHFREAVSCACLVLPLATLSFYVVKAYLLPVRKRVWAAESTHLLFEEEFCSVRLASCDCRSQQGVELTRFQTDA